MRNGFANSIESVNPNPTIAWFDGPWTGDLKQLVSNKCVYEQKWTLMCEIYNYFIHSHTRQTIPALYCIHPQHTHSPRHQHALHAQQLPSTTLLCTQLTNTIVSRTPCKRVWPARLQTQSIVGKMAQDVGMMYGKCVVVSFLSCLASFWGLHPYMRLFSFGKLFCDLFLLLFFRNSKREERQARGRWIACKVWKHRSVLFTKNKELS